MRIGKVSLHRNACEDWRALIERAAVEDLPDAAARALQSHAAGCARCREGIERAGRLTELLRGAPQPRWPEGQPLLPPAAAAVAGQTRSSGEPWGRRARGGPAADAEAGAEVGAAAGGDAEARAGADAPHRPAFPAERPSWRLLLPIAALALVLLAILLSRGRREPAPRQIDLVSPPGGIAAAWGVATICASLDPPLSGESLRLLVDERDVTAASELTPDFILYTSPEPFDPGPHLVALVVHDRSGAPVDERTWLVMAEPEEGEKKP
jgi:hypothetical protein